MAGDDQNLFVVTVLSGVAAEACGQPAEDGMDLANGAKWIPPKVTEARRGGDKAPLHKEDPIDSSTWYWMLPGDVRIDHGVVE